jgi:predicted nuclease of predicted toxin-antitoxin system
MTFLADECCDADLVEDLRRDGYDVTYVVESMRGASDTAGLHRAQAEERLLLTEDKDFGELVYRLRRSVPGIILLRFDAAHRELKFPRLRTLLERKSDQLEGAFVVLDPDRARIRPLA